MSVSGVKRKKTAGAKPKKRQRVEEVTRKVLSEGELAWNEVSLPDHLDDAEGFFGLEEIDDVEVVKGADNVIQFRAKENQKKIATDQSETPQLDGEESEWSGFGDDGGDDTAASVPKPTTAAAAAATKSKKTESKKTEAKKTESKKTETQGGKSILKQNKADEQLRSTNGNAFSLLSEDMPDLGVEMSAWDELNLSPEVLSGLADLRFGKPTNIQEACIPDIIAGHDVIGKASTGSGKTLAYGIPILQSYLSNSKSPTALILSPTRELAHQISKHLSALFEGATTPPRIATVTGGMSVQKQERQLSDADVVVATPGRLWEVIDNSQGVIKKLKEVRMLVVDEADRLLSEGHFQEVDQILEALDKDVVEEADEQVTKPTSKRRRQVLVFSATFHKGLHQKLAGKAKADGMLTNQQSMEYLIKKLPFRGKPKFIDVNPASQMVDTLKEGIIECGAMEKDLYLYSVLLQNMSKRTLVFTNSIHAVKRITAVLQTLALQAWALHSTMPQKARLRSVERFTTTPRSILVATDVAARGLDIKNIELIIHYHVPRSADMYVHRSGRTARASAVGQSIMLCSPDEAKDVTRLIAKVHSTMLPLSIDRRLVNLLSPRIKLAQRIVDSTQAQEKAHSSDNWLRNAAEDLGVDYDSDEFAANAQRGSRGRSNTKKPGEDKKIKSKAELQGLRGELKELLSRRVNLGYSEKYLAGGGLDVNQLLRERDAAAAGGVNGNGKNGGEFLGKVDVMNF